MRNIAIVGLGSESHGDAPRLDPDWEIWGLPWDPLWASCDLLFDMHAESASNSFECWATDLLDRTDLEDDDYPVYMIRASEKFPSSLTYPIDDVIDEVGDYFGSSVAFMLGLAIYEEVGRIGLWGVDLSDSIYDHQRPNIEYLIGFARGRGIDVEVHGPAPLLKNFRNGKRFMRYGQIEE